MESYIPIDALFAHDGINPHGSTGNQPRDLIEAADVIFSYDGATKERALIFGRKMLEETEASEDERELSIVVIQLDQEIGDMDRLLAFVHVLKGYHDYDERSVQSQEEFSFSAVSGTAQRSLPSTGEG